MKKKTTAGVSAQLREARLEHELLSQQITNDTIRQFRESVPEFARDHDESEWVALSSGKTVYHENDIREMQDQAAKLYYKIPTARGIVEMMVNFVIGKSCKIVPVSELPELVSYWEKFVEVNDWDLRGKECVRRAFRDGEMFLRRFASKMIGGVPMVRNVDPQEIVSPDGNRLNSFGIETDPDDVETAVNYFRSYADNGGVQQHETIPADEMIHFKIGVDSNVKRGVSFLVGIAPYIVRYKNWLDARIKLNEIRSRFILAAKITGAGSAQQIKDMFADTESGQVDNRGGARKKMPKSGSVFAHRGFEWDFKNLNINAADTKDDGRAILLMITSGTGMAEYMVTGDASNANYACESSDTEVLTDGGWMDQDELTGSERIATVNPVSGELEYQFPKAIHRFFHNGEMVCIKGDHNLDMMVTPNHRMWVTQHQMRRVDGNLIRSGLKDYHFVEAGKLSKESYIVQSTVEWNGKTDTVVIPGIERLKGGGGIGKPMQDRKCNSRVWASFLGYFISEGWILDNGKKRWVVGLSQNAGRIADKIRMTLSEMPIHWQEIKIPGGFAWTAYDKALWHHLKQTVGAGAYNKHIPEYAKSWDREHLRILIESLIDGDGHRAGSHSAYFTVSTNLADDVMEIAIKAGYITGIKKQMANGVFPIAIKQPKNVRIVPKTHISRVMYSGIVWCPEVPNGLFIARRNGIPHIHGNSTMVSEAPAVRTFEAWQDVFEKMFKRIFRWVIEYGMLVGSIPRTHMAKTIGIDPVTGKAESAIAEVETSTDCLVSFPTLIHHDIKADTDALVLAQNNGWASRRTCQVRLNLDPEEEDQQMAREQGEMAGSESPIEGPAKEPVA